MKKLIVLSLVLTAFALSSCATIMLSTSQEVSISSNPSGAMVTNNGVQLGKTPLAVGLSRKGNHRIKIELEGYLPYEVILSKTMSGWVFGNIIFGGIPGLIVDLITGGVYVLKPDQIQAELRNQNARVSPKENQMIIAATMQVDPSWQKIGELVKK